MLEENILDDTAIGNKYNVHRNTINNINRCKTWADVHNYEKNIRDEYSQAKFNRSSKAGSGSPTAKITEEQAKEIIRLIEQTTLSMPKIAKQLGVSLYIVEDIKRCKTWKHLHNYKGNIRFEYQRRMI